MLMTVLFFVLHGPPNPNGGGCTVEGKVTLTRNGAPVSGEGRVVVYLDEKVRRQGGAPVTHTMVQEKLKFRPDVLVIRKNDSIEFVNKDKSEHNVFSLSPYFDLQKSKLGVTGTQKFEINQAVRVLCDVHTFMRADVLVLEHRLFGIVDAEGNYRIDGLPEGDHQFRAWEPNGTVVQFNVKGCVGVTRAPPQTLEEGAKPAPVSKNDTLPDDIDYRH